MNKSDDLIRRQDAIEEIARWIGYIDEDMILRIQTGLKKLPSAQRWIPISEGPPEEDTDVLISYRYKEGEGDASHAYIDITSYGDMYFGGRKVTGEKHWRQPFEYFTSNYEVVAWMPLPEPWKGGER